MNKWKSEKAEGRQTARERTRQREHIIWEAGLHGMEYPGSPICMFLIGGRKLETPKERTGSEHANTQTATQAQD